MDLHTKRVLLSSKKSKVYHHIMPVNSDFTLKYFILNLNYDVVQ
jgi:hypothetical protein